MEHQKQNTSSHWGEKSNNLSFNLIYGQNPPPISNISWRELISPCARRKIDHHKTGQLCTQKGGKRAVSKNCEKTKSCKKMRKSEDRNTDNFKAWSPRAMESAKEVRVANEKASTLTSSKRCRIENEAKKQPTLRKPNSQFKRVLLIPQENVEANNSLVVTKYHPLLNINSPDEEEINCTGRSNNLNAVDKSSIETNLDSCTTRTELEKQGTFEKQNSQSTPVPLSIPSDSIEIVNLDAKNSLSAANSHPPSNLISPRDGFVKPTEDISDCNFRIIVDGSDITSEIKPKARRIIYFHLCRDHNSLLHGDLVEGINLNHAVFVISQTVDIFNAIKTSDISTPQKEIIYWRKALQSFSMIGMDVGFMLARVNRLLDLKIKETKAVDRKRDEEAKTEEEGLDKKIRALESEIEKMREEKRRIQEEREGIRKKANEFETMFRLEASAPW